MPTPLSRCFLTLAFSLLVVLPSVADEAAKPAPDETAQPAPDKAAQPVADESSEQPQPIELEGVFESRVAREIAANSEQIDAYRIKRILEHGSAVKKGAAVVWFETKEIDTKITKAEHDLAVAELDFENAEFAYQQFRDEQALDRQAAKLARREAKQAYENYVNVDRQQNIKAAEVQLKQAVEALEYAQEELDQLEKMYLEDDLTEESEEIVLKRARRAVERAEYNLEVTQQRTERTLKQTIPSELPKREATLARAELAFAKAMQDAKAARTKRDLQRRRQRVELEKQRADFKALQAERRAFVLTSPIDGVLYHGRLTRGRLADKASTLDKHSKVTATQVLATIVKPERLRIRADLSEAQRADLSVGMKGTAIPKAFPQRNIPVTIHSIGKVPFAANKFDCVLKIDGKLKHDELVPGITCRVEFEKAKQE